MDDFKKTVRLGTIETRPGSGRYVSIFCFIQYHDKPPLGLSITGVIGPTQAGNSIGGSGQIVMSLLENKEYRKIRPAPGWDMAHIYAFLLSWDKWHLNDMRAGSPAQMAFLAEHPIDDRLNYFKKASAALEAAGLNPDPNYLHQGKPYKYGTAWLHTEVPADVLEFLRKLPDTDKPVPGGWGR